MQEALEDDLNTPLALARMHELVGMINRTSSDAARSAFQRALEQAGGLMGLLQHNPLDWLRAGPRFVAAVGRAAGVSTAVGVAESVELQDEVTAKLVNPRIDSLIGKRAELRRQRRYAEADSIRAKLEAQGIILEDRPDGTTTWWRKD